MSSKANHIAGLHSPEALWLAELLVSQKINLAYTSISPTFSDPFPFQLSCSSSLHKQPFLALFLSPSPHIEFTGMTKDETSTIKQYKNRDTGQNGPIALKLGYSFPHSAALSHAKLSNRCLQAMESSSNHYAHSPVILGLRRCYIILLSWYLRSNLHWAGVEIA